MFAGHLAAAAALKAAEPKAPAWALFTGAFLPDLFWIAFAGVGLEYPKAAPLFDDWSHSLLSILLQATIFALFFLPRGQLVCLAIWAAVFSHFLLDAPIHPLPLQLYPHASLPVSWPLWSWGKEAALLGKTHYWWVQLGVVLVLLAFYVARRNRMQIPGRLIAATCTLILGMHLLF